ncbi:MAG: fumarylacetoacetate hydrolase family protein [Actinomycetota bacterium]|nr:fumarylacetoacetate hydrolase family protein [Actinomycetota bacterium]
MTERTWLPVPPASDFPIENLPFGVARPADGTPRVVTRIGDHLLDLPAAGIAPDLTARSTLNALMESGRGAEVRARAAELLTGPERPDAVHLLSDVELLLPIQVGDYVDFYSSIHHATNLGRIFRPEGEPLPANWRHLPIGYHGRAGTVVVSGSRIARPSGLVPDPIDGVPRLTPTCALDFELEVAFLVGGPTATQIRPDDVGGHVFGVALCNDWSARDIQSFEYQPLGPNLAKSFATTISPWVVTLDAVRPYLVAPPTQEPEPDPYLHATKPWALDLHLEVDRNGATITETNFSAMYWTFAQQLAHITVNGATTRSGDVFASGTVSGPTPGERGSLIEQIADATADTYLADGDVVTLRGWCGGDAADRPRVGFGEASGTVVATVEEV